MKGTFDDLIHDKKYDELENFWLERMEGAQSTLQEFLRAAKLLGRQKEKERAELLLSLLAQHFLENQNWRERLRVLVEMARHTADEKRFQQFKYQISDTLHHCYSDRPSFTRLMRHFDVERIPTGDELKEKIDLLEQWLSRDIGQFFYQPGYGAGRVTEINLNLGLVRLDFERKKDVSLEIGDTTLIPLPTDHVLRDKLERPAEIKEQAMREPHVFLSRILKDLNRSLTVNEIKEAVSGIISHDEWSRWWTHARKHSQVVVSGKGVSATYSWSDSDVAAEEAVQKSFDESAVEDRIQLARQHAARSADLARYFSERLCQQARHAHENRNYTIVLEILDLFGKWPYEPIPDAGFSMGEILASRPPAELLSQVNNASLRMKVLEQYPDVRSQEWQSIYTDCFLSEQTPRISEFLFSRLAEENLTDPIVDRIAKQPYHHAAAFTWIAEAGAREGPLRSRINRVLNGAFLVSLLHLMEDAAGAPYRTRLKKAVEGGLLIEILNGGVDEDSARKIVDLLDHSTVIEDYRIARWKNAVLMRFPQIKKKEDWIFATEPAVNRKRAELEQLIEVELPTNRKAVGEAAAHGDLRENHEYKAARERQEYLINRVQQLQHDLGRVRLIEPGKTDTSEVRPGTQITLHQEQDRRTIVTLLGPWDSDPTAAVYSYQSAIGEELLGKGVGDNVRLGEESWTIEKIEAWK